MKNSWVLICLSLLSFSTFGQFRSFKYASEIQKPTSSWHKIQLEENVLGASKADLSDIRIFQVVGKDTSEAPYLIDRLDMEKAELPLLLPLKKNAFRVIEDKEMKQTLISVGFIQKKPISGIKLDIGNNFDYYRRFSLYASMDSIFETERDEVQFVYSGNLSSLEKAEFSFDQVFARYFLIIIENEDNKPLPVKSCEMLYEPVSLVARFENGGRYFLCYGDPEINSPDYDLNYFRDKIPGDVTALSYEIIEATDAPAEEETMRADVKDTNPAWLWLAISVIVLLLLIFTLRMLKVKG